MRRIARRGLRAQLRSCCLIPFTSKVCAFSGRLVYSGKQGIRMRRKKPAQDESVIPQEILEAAKRSMVTDWAKPVRVRKCSVCDDEVAPNSTEDLCWVCRRLKISAWRESDHQMPAAE